MRLLPALLLLSIAACDEPDRSTGEVEAAVSRVDAWSHYEAGDHAAFTAALEELTAEDPRPKDVYNLACGYALTGRPDEAMERLTWLVDRGEPFLIHDDPDLDSLRERADFQALLLRLETYSKAAEYLRPARQLAVQRYRAGDHEAFVLIMEKLAPLSDRAIDRYNLACAYALSGRHDEAIAELERLADVGEDFGAAEDPDFHGLRDDPRFQAVLARL